MGWTFVRATPTFMRSDTVGVSARPLTLSAWCQISAVTGLMVAVYTGTPGAVFNRCMLGRTGTSLRVQSRGATTEAVQTQTGLPAAGTWYHGAAVIASPTSLIPYVDGVAGTELTTDTGAASAYTRTSLGQVDQTTPQDAFDGLIAEPAIWDVALPAGDIALLAAGASPMSLATRPVRYWRLKDDLDLSDLIVGAVLTNTGATWTASHPTVDDPPGAVEALVSESLAFRSKQRAPMPMIVGPRADSIMRLYR